MDAQEERMIAVWANGGQATEGSKLGGEAGRDVEDGSFELPMLALQPEEMGSKESRRRTLHQLDDLLEALEQASLADQLDAPETVAHKLSQRGLPEPRAYTVPQLIEIVFKTQAVLMRANRSAHEPDAAGANERLIAPFLLVG